MNFHRSKPTSTSEDEKTVIADMIFLASPDGDIYEIPRSHQSRLLFTEDYGMEDDDSSEVSYWGEEFLQEEPEIEGRGLAGMAMV